MSEFIANSRFKGERQNLLAKEIAYGRNFCGMGGSFSIWAKILTYERFQSRIKNSKETKNSFPRLFLLLIP
ncbi:hypothetical protein AC622_07405 [Bacillus sp. FJAT-27916]|uniref:hypothetical protein n=1 Tax=Bacillaceae TaxID=186817 RepID=UPI0006712547|nr:hypothetical protein [Bacillus sp. FJAT-27916]KMY44101.1 hypothetical protein AC622_07405 [Bacillus sp. FJAT-27916]